MTGTCVRSDASDGGTGDVATSAGTTTEVVTMQVIFGGATSTGAGVVSANCQATISEAGLFNSVTAATDEMFAYQTFTGILIGASDTLTVTWTVGIAYSARKKKSVEYPFFLIFNLILVIFYIIIIYIFY